MVDDTGRHSAAIALSEAAQAALLAWVPISYSLASARTLDADEETKDSFYGELQEAIGRVPTGDMLIVAGDWSQGPVPWTRQHGISWVSLQLARGALMVTVW